MNLLAVVVTHDRLALTKRCLDSYRETVTLPSTLIVVDTGSEDGTSDYLAEQCERALIEDFMFCRGYAGAAFNEGVSLGLRYAIEEPTHLLFADNDVEFLPGWCEEVEARFFESEQLGQLGLMLEKYEQGASNVGNNSVIPRWLWDDGLRWPVQPWHGEVVMSAAVRGRSLQVERVETECIVHHGWDWDAYPTYYERIARDKGLDPGWVREHFDRMRSL